MTTALGIIGALLGIAFTAWRWWVGRQGKQDAERERALGRLQERDKQNAEDAKALAKAKEVKDDVEARGSGQLRDSLGRWVRKP